MQDITRVLIGRIPDGFLVQVTGKGTMEYCADLFQQVAAAIDDGTVHTVFFDLSKTQYLDSSFIGVIVSIQKKLKKNLPDTGEVILLDPSERVVEILSTMGLLELLPIRKDNEYKNVDYGEEIRKRLDKTYEHIKILLESHQNLMEVNSDNRRKFSLVEEMLKKELERQKP